MKKIALITGASRGLGATLARHLAARDFALVLTSRTAHKLERLADELTDRGTAVRALHGDIAEPIHPPQAGRSGARPRGSRHPDQQRIGARRDWSARLRRRDASRTCSSCQRRGADCADRRRAAAADRSKGARRQCVERRRTGAYSGWGAYGASKAALDLATRTLAGELAPASVGVVAVDPGDLRTDMHQEAFPRSGHLRSSVA